MAGDPGPVPGGEAEFNTMHDLAVDSAGNLWIADSKNNLVRVLFDPANAPALGAPAPPTTPPPAGQPPAGSPPAGANANADPQFGLLDARQRRQDLPLRRREVDGRPECEPPGRNEGHAHRADAHRQGLLDHQRGRPGLRLR